MFPEIVSTGTRTCKRSHFSSFHELDLGFSILNIECSFSDLRSFSKDVNALGDTMHYEEVLECLIFHPLYFFSVIEDFPAVGGHAARGARRDFLDHAHAFQFVVERGDDCFSAAPIRVVYVVLGFGMVKLHGG